MYVVRRDCTPHDDHISRLADLAYQVARTLGSPTAQYLIPVFRAPDHVILQIEHRVRAMPVFRHPLIVEGVERALLGLSRDADPAAIASAVDELVTASQAPQYRGLVDVVTARQLLDDIRSSPTVAAMEAALLLAAAASLALTMLTVVLASVAAAAARNRLIGVLRILGMSRRQLRAIQAWELGPVAITAVVAGTALGLVLPLIVTSALDLRPFRRVLRHPA